MLSKRRIISALLGGYSIFLGVFLIQQQVFADMVNTFTVCPLHTGQAYTSAGSSDVYYITKNCSARQFVNSTEFYAYASPFNLLHTVAPNILGTFDLDVERKVWKDSHILRDISFVVEQETNDVYFIADRKRHKLNNGAEVLVDLYQADMITTLSRVDLAAYEFDVLEIAHDSDDRLFDTLVVDPEHDLFFQLKKSGDGLFELRPSNKKKAFTKFLSRTHVIFTAIPFSEHIDSQLRSHDADIVCEALESGVCIYVSAEGHLTLSDGSFHAPYRTFFDAIADKRLVPGSIIYAFDDAPFTFANTKPTYTNSETKKIYNSLIAIGPDAPSGTIEEPIVIRAYPGTVPLFDMRGHFSTSDIHPLAQTSVSISGVSHWTIEGITSRGGMWYIGAGENDALTHDITLDHNTISYISAPQKMAAAGAIMIDRGYNAVGAYNIDILRNIISDVSVYNTASTNEGPWTVAGITVLSRQTYEGDVPGTGAVRIEGNTISEVPQAFLFADPMEGPIEILENTIFDAHAIGTLHAANVQMKLNVVVDVTDGWLSVGGDLFGDERDEIHGTNAVIDHNTFIGIDRLFDLQGGSNHTVTNNVFFGLSNVALTAEDDALAYMTVNTGREPESEEESLLKNIVSNHNCFFVPSAEVQFATRSFVPTGTPHSVLTAHYTFDTASTAFGLDVSSTIHTGLDMSDVFSPEFTLKNTTLCPDAGANRPLLDIPTDFHTTTSSSTEDNVFSE